MIDRDIVAADLLQRPSGHNRILRADEKAHDDRPTDVARKHSLPRIVFHLVDGLHLFDLVGRGAEVSVRAARRHDHRRARRSCQHFLIAEAHLAALLLLRARRGGHSGHLLIKA